LTRSFFAFSAKVGQSLAVSPDPGGQRGAHVAFPLGGVVRREQEVVHAVGEGRGPDVERRKAAPAEHVGVLLRVTGGVDRSAGRQLRGDELARADGAVSRSDVVGGPAHAGKAKHHRAAGDPRGEPEPSAAEPMTLPPTVAPTSAPAPVSANDQRIGEQHAADHPGRE